MARKLLNLAQDNRGKGAGIRAELAGEDCTNIYIYDVIDGWWGVSAMDFANTLAGITTPKVCLRINSPGGDVFEARSMMAAMAEHKAEFSARIDGLCASAATALTLPCKTVNIADGGFYMIHQAWTFAMGNADDMRATAQLLDKVDATIVAGYAAKSGKSNDEVLTLMKAETWFDAQEAVDAGFCDSVIEIPVSPAGGGTSEDAASNRADLRMFNLAVYDRVPETLTSPPQDKQSEDAVRQRMLARIGLYERTAG